MHSSVGLTAAFFLQVVEAGRRKKKEPPPPPPPPSITVTIPYPEELPPPEELGYYVAAAATLFVVVLLVRLLWHPYVPLVKIDLNEDESADVLPDAEPKSSPRSQRDADAIVCVDPSTGRLLGTAKAMSAAEVSKCVEKAHVAQQAWASSTFAQRRQLLRILSRCTLAHAADICRVSARDSGKTTTDAAFGEVLVTLEKLAWLCSEGEACLKPEYRSAGRMLFYKRARIEFHPRGVVGAIVPWNYPFHNVLNPISAAVRMQP